MYTGPICFQNFIAQYTRLGQFSRGHQLPPHDAIYTRLNSKNQLISGNCSHIHYLINLRMLTADTVKPVSCTFHLTQYFTKTHHKLKICLSFINRAESSRYMFFKAEKFTKFDHNEEIQFCEFTVRVSNSFQFIDSHQ